MRRGRFFAIRCLGSRLNISRRPWGRASASLALVLLAVSARGQTPVEGGAGRGSGSHATRVAGKATSARQVTGPVDHLQVAAGDPMGSNMVIELRPMYTYPGGTYNTGGCYDQSNISGNTLSIAGGPCRTFWNLFLSNWDPNDDRNPPLRNFQARVDDMTLSTGCGAPLTRCTDQPCTLSSHCRTAFGENGSACNQFTPGHCNYAWVNKLETRTDRFRADLPWPDCDDPVWEVGLVSPMGPLFFGSNPPEPCGLKDPHTPVYGGTYCINAPAAADGTYTLGFRDEETFGTNPNSILFVNITRTPGVLVVSDECGDGTCDLPCEDCSNCPADCPVCGDGACDSECEDCANCPADCGCASCTHECVAGMCEPTCGDGTCDPQCEDCDACPADCACEPCAEACQEGACLSTCGDAFCDSECEDCANCPQDCGCSTCTQRCFGGACLPACGDGMCDAGCEDCSVCPADCGCEGCTEVCSQGVCEPTCGDETCDPACEDCGACPEDCESACGDGVCDVCETSQACPADCATLVDFADFQVCFGLEAPLPPECSEFDSDESGDIGLDDYQHFIEHSSSGP